MSEVVTRAVDTKMESILKKYLNTIVYIDDKFGLSLIGDSEETVTELPGRINRRNIRKDFIEEKEDFYIKGSSNIEPDKLSVLLEKMQRKYPSIKLLPVKYTDSNDISYVETSIESSKLIVIDWQLTEVGGSSTEKKYTAVDALSCAMKSSNKMKLLVVYTSDPEGAEMDFISKEVIKKFNEGEINNKKYKFAILESSIVMICKKSDFNAENLIEAYAKLIINNFGFFPVAFIDMLLKLDDKVGYLLKKFSQPFDSVLLMQLENSGLQYDDNTELIRNLVTNSVYDEINCDACIVDNMYQIRIKRLIDLSKCKDEDMAKKIDCATDFIIARCSSENKKVYKIIKNIEPDKWKAWLGEISPKPENWSISLKSFSDKLIDKITELQTEVIFFDFFGSGEQISKIKQIKTKIKSGCKEQIKNSIKDISSLFLMLLSEEKIGTSITELISNLKLNKYDDPDELKYISECVEFKEDGRIEEKCKENLRNKLFQGDIIYKKKDDTLYEFLICIVPSCQMLRPDKVDYIISYAKGEVTIFNEKQKRDSEHFSIIPDPENKDKLLNVKWKFHDIKKFDLKTEDRNKLKEYKRPYRLTDDYFRQLMSEFNSFYSKIGVEDLFIKKSPVLADIFLRDSKK